MTNAKAKDRERWEIWHYGILKDSGVLIEKGRSVEILGRTVCEDTGYRCKGIPVYENDWLEVIGAGEKHRFLVEKVGEVFLASEDGEVYYSLSGVVSDATCRITGNLYD